MLRWSSAKVCVRIGGGGIVWFGAKYFEMLTVCHRIISDPNHSPTDISSDVLLKIILSHVIYSLKAKYTIISDSLS